MSVSLNKIDICFMMYVIEFGYFLYNFYLICVVELLFLCVNICFVNNIFIKEYFWLIFVKDWIKVVFFLLEKYLYVLKICLSIVSWYYES